MFERCWDGAVALRGTIRFLSNILGSCVRFGLWLLTGLKIVVLFPCLKSRPRFHRKYLCRESLSVDILRGLRLTEWPDFPILCYGAPKTRTVIHLAKTPFVRMWLELHMWLISFLIWRLGRVLVIRQRLTLRTYLLLSCKLCCNDFPFE